MKQIITILMVSLWANSVCYAQKNITRVVTKKAPVKSAVSQGTLSHYGGITGAGMGVDFHLTRVSTQALGTASQAPKTLSAPNRSWATQQIRNIKAYQIKKERRQQEQLRKQAQEKFELAMQEMPLLLTEKSFDATDLSAYIPQHNQQPKPTVPFLPLAGEVAYRGLSLSADGDSIRNILTNGLRLQDAGEENSTLRLAYASHGGYYAMRHLLENPVTNITYGPNSAATWGAKHLGHSLPILTIVKIKGNFLGDSMETVTEDIPASQIEELVVRLNLDDNLTWCKVQLNPDNSFTLTPYEPKYKSKEARGCLLYH